MAATRSRLPQPFVEFRWQRPAGGFHWVEDKTIEDEGCLETLLEWRSECIPNTPLTVEAFRDDALNFKIRDVNRKTDFPAFLENYTRTKVQPILTDGNRVDGDACVFRSS